MVHQPNPVSPRELSLLFGLEPGPRDHRAHERRHGLSPRVPLAGAPRRGVVGQRGTTALGGRPPDRPWQALGGGPAGRQRPDAGRLAATGAGAIIEVVENGIDPTSWDATRATATPKPPRPDGRVQLLFVGRLIALKGVDFLLEAFRQVRDEEPTAALEFIGDGPKRLELAARARQLGLDDVITFTGWLTRPEVADRMSQADVFVLPSLCESGGNAVLEAMVAGVPVIASAGRPRRLLERPMRPAGRSRLARDSSRGWPRRCFGSSARPHSAGTGSKRPAARRPVLRLERKIDRLLEIYRKFETSWQLPASQLESPPVLWSIKAPDEKKSSP